MARRSWLLSAALPIVLAAGPGAAAASPRLPLHRCIVHGASARCGTLTVPENRAVPGGRTISLRVVVRRGPGSPHRADPVFYLAGGPGDSATDAASRFPFQIYWERDLVLVDQRGTGGSHQLACPELTDAPAVEAIGRLLACLGRLRADPAQYGTVAAMQDVEAVRAALGYRRINLLGISYGTVAAQIYLRLFPGRVRSVVLDSGMILGTSLSQTPQWVQRALDLVAARCKADRVCARRFPDWYTGLPALLERLRSHPVEVTVRGSPLTIDALLAEWTIYVLTRSSSGAAGVPLLVSRAIAGDYAMLARTASDLEAAFRSEPPLVMSLAITCNEPWAQRDPDALAAAARGTYVEDLFADGGSTTAICGALPGWTEPPERWLPVRSSVPVLALAGEADPVLPPSAMTGLRQAMPTSRLVVVPGQGHVVVALPCIPDLVERFLETRAPRSLDARCVRTITPPDWVTTWP
jgi:pimeloyl-ACP methyl ester carboxylesterase